MLNRVELIVVREEDSRELLYEIGVKIANLHVAADLAFLLEPAPAERTSAILKENDLIKDDRMVVAVGLNGRHTERPGYTETIANCCDHLIEMHNAVIWFVPFQTHVETEDHQDHYIDLDDRSGMRLIADRIARQDCVGFMNSACSPSEVMGLMCQADLVIGERFHAALFSINNHCSVMGISYMPKVSRLFDELGHPEWCLDLNELDQSKLASTVDYLIENRQQVVSVLETFSDRMRAKALENYELLVKTLTD